MTKSLEDRIASLEDAILHQNEIGFEILCEKYVDECAMRAMQGMLDWNGVPLELVVKTAYDAAEAMLKEKLKRNETK